METENNVVKIAFKSQEYLFIKGQQTWELLMKQSDVHVKDERKLDLLKVPSDYLLDVEHTATEDSFTFVFTDVSGKKSFEEVRELEQVDKLRLASNLVAVSELLSYPITFFVHPENILFDQNLIPKLAYRGLLNEMPPTDMTEADLLRQLKCLIVCLFQKKADFNILYDGGLEQFENDKFSKTIIQQTSFEALATYLTKVYRENNATREISTRRVSKIKYKVYQQLSIWLGVFLVLALVAAGYFLFMKVPFQDRMLAVDQAFLKSDYEEVIQKLKNDEIERIPYTQKYILAYSYIQGEELSNNQRKTIMNNLTLRTDENYLIYWIQNGRGDLTEALDTAQKVEDSDLILYALLQTIEQVRNDTQLSGEEKSQKITEYQTQYESYQKQKDEMLEEGGEPTQESKEISEETDQSSEVEQETTTSSTGGK